MSSLQKEPVTVARNLLFAADYDAIVSHDFTSIQLFKLDLTASAGLTPNSDGTIFAGTAALLGDLFTWTLY